MSILLWMTDLYFYLSLCLNKNQPLDLIIFWSGFTIKKWSESVPEVPLSTGQFKFFTVSTGASRDHDVPANSNFLLRAQERQKTMMYQPIQIFYWEHRSVKRPWCTGQFKFSTVSTGASKDHNVPANSNFLLCVQGRQDTIMYRPIQIFYCEYRSVKRP